MNDSIIVVVWLVIQCSTFLFELISRIKRSVFFIVRRTFIFSVVTTFDFWRHTVELTFYFNVWKPAFYFSGKAEYFTSKPIVRTVLTSVLLICINKMHNSNAMQMRYLPVVCTVFKDVYYSYISQMHNDPTQWRTLVVVCTVYWLVCVSHILVKFKAVQHKLVISTSILSNEIMSDIY